MKRILGFFLGCSAAIGSTMILPKAANAEIGWSHTYQCGNYTITLRQYALDQFSYSARSPQGNIDLSDGYRFNGNASWIYQFRNANTTYQLEDAWNSPQHPGGFATLSVYQNEERILVQSCRK